MSNLTSHLELERYLNDKNKFIILHTLDGEIWGASSSAMELLGYSTEEIQQIYLANIKPKSLRLSDVCKVQQEKDAPIIFERRNGRRFSASVDTKIIRTTLQNKSVDLVHLELDLINTSPSSSPISDLNIQETTDHIQALTKELNTPLHHIDHFLKALSNTGLNSEQSLLVKNVSKLFGDINFLNNNITDSVKLGVNALSLERQPYNIIDLLGHYVDQWGKETTGISVCIDRSVPELVYGDETRLTQILGNFTRKSLSLFKPEKISLSISQEIERGKENEEEAEKIHFTLKMSSPRPNKTTDESIQPHINSEQQPSLFSEFSEAAGTFISKNLIRLMGGSLQITKKENSQITLSFSLLLPEVHDLGLKGNRKFLKQSRILLIEHSDSLLYDQLHTWGAQIERFQSLKDAFKYQLSNSESHRLIVIVHINDNSEFDQPYLTKISELQNTDLLLIKPENRIIEGSSDIINLQSPYQPALLGNILSQYVHTQFPFPYINMHQKRNDTYNENSHGRILLVDDLDEARLPIQEMLEKNNYEVDIAINGIDSVLACAHYRYDLVLMSINLPYMDGLEAVIHLRKISELNLHTPIIILGTESSENIKQSMRQVGVESMILKPINMASLLVMVSSHINEIESNTGDISNKEKTHLRRVYDAELEPSETLVDKDIIKRLIEDTDESICREMVDMFIEESLLSIGELEKSCQLGDWKNATNHANNICSSSQTFGCEALTNIAMQLEEESKKSNLGECIRLTSKLPKIFLQSQQCLYDIFSERT